MNHLISSRNTPIRLAAWLLASSFVLFSSGCQLADMARFTYANATATHEWANPEETTTVPFTLIDNHIIVPVRVNGSEPLNFVLDSGAAATVIMDSRGSRALQLQKAGELPVSGVGTGPDQIAHIVPDTTLAVGEVSLQGQSVIYLPLDSIPFFDDLDHVYFDGVIGAPFFNRFVVEIDYDLQLLSFTEPELAAQRIASLDDSWREVPIEVEYGVPYMTALVDVGEGPALDLKLLVDTGFRGALSLTPSTDDRLREPRNYYRSVSQGISGEVISHVAMTESLSLADYQLQQMPVMYAVAGGESDDDSNGLLGNEVLQQFNLVFDYPNGRLHLAPNHNFDTRIGADRSGLQLRPHVAGGIVKRVAADGPALTSPLQVGDIITSFDDTPVTYGSIAELKRVLASDRDSVRLCWESSEVSRCEDLALATRL